MLQRQAGVEKATYSRDGVVEIEAKTEAPFEVKRILSVLKDEMGFDPIREIEVTVVGQLSSTSAGWIVKPKNSVEAFALVENEELQGLKARENIEHQEIRLTGRLQKRADGTLALKVEAVER
ncbi:hypothetical protein HRbin08_00031 [bacterium HR08]|nr:hypothetical protein HRbin08_00031 [bacterium HR08]